MQPPQTQPDPAPQTETISFAGRHKGQPVQITATVYWPAKAGPVPALVIHHGAAGVNEGLKWRAREMAKIGVAGVLIDSFGPRGVSSSVQDQAAVTRVDFNLDALGVLKALGANSRIDRTKIGILGYGKGAGSALMASHERLVVAAGVPAGLRYALHVAFYPSCAVQPYRPKTTGAPIYMLLGGADTSVGFEPCQTYGEALRAAGARIEVKVFPNAPNSFDGGSPFNDPKGQNYSQCVYQEQANGSWIERKSGVMVAGADGKWMESAEAKAAAVCRTLGVSGGPDAAAAKQSNDDLNGYVRRHLTGG